MPIANPSDARIVDELIRATLIGSTVADSIASLRQLFVERLDFNLESGTIALHGEGLPPTATRVAQRQGVHVVAVVLPNLGRVTAVSVRATLSSIRTSLGGEVFLVAANGDRSQWNFIYPTDQGGKETLRRMVVERGVPFRTIAERLTMIWQQADSTSDIRQALDHAYDVEAVTHKFFEEYRRVFDKVQGLVTGLSGDDLKLFCQTLFNRLMFLYFLQRKGWLRFAGDQDYLAALWKNWKTAQQPSEGSFYDARLKILFFVALNNPRHSDFDLARAAVSSIIGDVPFLNGGLFEETDLDRRDGVSVPNEAIDAILHELFDPFNFTIAESTPYDVQVAVDPEMLGKVFEEMVTGRHESGSYYTPRPIVSFMCREALKNYLVTKVIGLSPTAAAAFVEAHRVDGMTMSQAAKVIGVLESITVVDPACGSGAYLLGMLHELVDLQELVYSSSLIHDSKSLYEQKLHIIERNLYGADIDPFAVNIAMLRLWLSLAIDYEGTGAPPPLPNLDFKIVCGDSLLAPNPNSELETDLFRFRARELSGELAQLKASFVRETGDAKRLLEGRIEQKYVELVKVHLGSPAPTGSVDWRVEFAEVFDRSGGFDAVLANPPYVRIQALERAYAEKIRNQFQSARGKFDLYVPFVQRSIEILNNSGVAVLIMPNKFLSTQYGESLQLYLRSGLLWEYLVDFGDLQVFSTATNYTCIVVLCNGAGGSPAVEIRRASGETVEQVLNRFQAYQTNDIQIAENPVDSFLSQLHRNSAGTLGQLTKAIFQGLISGGDPTTTTTDSVGR